MRRAHPYIRLTIAAAVLVAMTASPALAAKPEKSALEGFTATFPAGVLCEFGVEWDIAGGGNQLVFPERPMAMLSSAVLGVTRDGYEPDSMPERSVQFRGGIRQVSCSMQRDVRRDHQWHVVAGCSRATSADRPSGCSAATCTTSLTQRSPPQLTVATATPRTFAPR